MPDWMIGLLILFAVILFVPLFFSLASKSLGKSFWENLKMFFLSFIVLLAIIAITAFTMIFFGNDYWSVSAGIMFSLVGLALVVGAPYMERNRRITSPPRVQEIQDILYTPNEKVKIFRIPGWIVFCLGIPFYFATPFVGQTEPTFILGGILLVGIYAGAVIIIVVELITILRMKRNQPEIARADRNTLLGIWPPIVFPMIGPWRAANWELFKKRLSFQKSFRVRDAFAAFIPDQKVKRVVWLMLFLMLIIFLFRPFLFPQNGSTSPLFEFLMPYKFSMLGLWSIALLGAYCDVRIRRKFMAALQDRVVELDSVG